MAIRQRNAHLPLSQTHPPYRHCEEHSDAAIPAAKHPHLGQFNPGVTSLPRYARHDLTDPAYARHPNQRTAKSRTSVRSVSQ